MDAYLRAHVGSLAPLPSICTVCGVLMLGKLLRFRYRWFSRRSVPSAIVAGALGVGIYRLLRLGGTSRLLVSGWATASPLLLDISFASLFLGFEAPKSAKAYWHEALPQLLYSQVVGWGSYAVALLTVGVARVLDDGVSPFLGVIVPIGFEGGALSVQNLDANGVMDRVRAEDVVAFGYVTATLGLVLAIAGGVFLINTRRYWDASPVSPVSESASPVEGSAWRQMASVDQQRPAAAGGESSRAFESFSVHLCVLGFALTIAFGIDTALLVLEDSVPALRKYHVLSSLPVFPYSIVGGFVVMRALSARRRALNHGFFLRLSSAALEFTVLIGMAVTELPALGWSDNVPAYAAVVGAVLLWQVFCFTALAPRLVPSWWFFRAVATMAESLGLTWTGLLLVKAMDPDMRTPVGLAYTLKQLLHNQVLAGGVWTTFSVVVVSTAGEWAAFAISVAALGAWLAVFHRYYRPRFPRRRRPRTKFAEGLAALRRRAAPGGGSGSVSGAELEPLSEPLIEPVSEEPDEPAAARPVLRDASAVLSAADAAKVARELPLSRREYDWAKLFDLQRDGASLSTLYRAAAAHAGPVVLVAQDTWGYALGFYCNEPLRQSSSYTGSGDMFVFTFEPEFEAFRWTGRNDMFVIAADAYLAVGGGPDFALWMDDALDNAASAPCDTFGNRRLTSSQQCKMVTVELWGLTLGL